MPVLVSVIGCSIIQFSFQLWTYLQTENILSTDDFVKCIQSDDVDEDDPPCSKNTALYLISCQQYLICCLTFSIAKPFRKPIWHNPLFLFSVIIMLAYQTYLFFNIDDWSEDTFQILDIPDYFKSYLLAVFLINSVLTYLYEKLFIIWFSKKCQSVQAERKQEEFRRMVRGEHEIVFGDMPDGGTRRSTRKSSIVGGHAGTSSE